MSSAFDGHLILEEGANLTDEDGYYWIDKNGTNHSSKEAYVRTEILGFCCCGLPEENLEYIHGALLLIDEEIPKGMRHEDWYPEHRACIDQYYMQNAGDRRAEYMMYYYLDHEEFIEHGTGLPGWLTDKGKELLAMLTEILEEKRLEENRCIQ